MGWNVCSQIDLLLFLLSLVLTASPLTAVQQITNPRIVEHPEDKYVGRNEAATLNCKAEGDPPPVITWYRNGDPVVTTIENPLSHRMLLPSGQLFFLRVVHSKNSRSDVGSYYCNATNPLTGVSSISQNASLHIAMIRDEFREQPQSANRVVGDDVLLTCRPPRGDPEPKVQWKKDGAPVQPGNHRVHVHEDGSLLIRGAEKTDAGMYSCVAQNIGGQRESKPARLNIFEKPKIIEAPVDQVVSEHSEIIFHCRATGVPEPTITWKKQKGTIPDQRSKLFDGGQSLKIRKVKVQDEGVYVCRVENSVGWQDAEARLSVLVQPSFVTMPSGKSVVLGRRVSFECIASGNPVPVVFWKKEDSQTLMFPENSYGRFTVGEFGTLVIDQVQRQDAGAFVCQAQSVAGSAAAKASLTVKETDSRPPPIIRHGLQNQTLPTKSTATLQCLTGGDPVPAVRWYRNGRVLDVTDQRIAVLDSGTLQINELHMTDTGWYTCKAISETGESSWSGALVIEPPTDTSVIFRRTPEPSTYPGAPSKPLVIDTRETSVKLSWKPNPNNGASQVSSYMVEYFSHETGEGWIVASDSVTASPYVVQRLQPNTSYRFLVRAQNSHGISLPSPVTGIIRTRGESLASSGNSSPVDPDPDLVASKLSTPIVFLSPPDAVTATTAHLRWDVRRSHRFVDGFHVKYCVVQGGGGVGGGGGGGEGPDLPPASCSIQTVQSVDARTHVLKDLEEDTQYMIYIQPYYQLKEGAASSTVLVHTLEDVPSAPPSSIQAVLSDNETLYLSWQAPARRHQNGVLIGYKIYLSSNDSLFSQDVFVNSSVLEMAIHDLPKYAVFSVQIAAATKLGEGVKSEEIIVGRSELGPGDHGIESKPWFLAAVIVGACSVVWVLVCVVVIVVCVCRRRGRRHVKYTEGQKKQQVDLVAGHDRDSKEDGLSNGKENLYENISSLCVNSMTKATYDGSSSSPTCPTTADSRGMGHHVGRRLIPPDLEPFCQAYIIKPKPPVGATTDNSREPRPMNCESLKITANNGYSPFVQSSSSSLYPSLHRQIRSNFPSSTEEEEEEEEEDIYRRHHHHATASPPQVFCPPGGSTLAAQRPSNNYGTTQQRTSLYGPSDARMARGPCRRQPVAACPNPGYRNERLLNAAAESDTEPHHPSSCVGRLHSRGSSGGVQRYFSDGEGALTVVDSVESFYRNPPSPALPENGTLLTDAPAKSSLMQNGHASTESHEE